MKLEVELSTGSKLYVRHFKFGNTGTTALFVHGGPGGNCYDFERFLELDLHAKKSDIDWIVYDQYGCGRSPKNEKAHSHGSNVDDLAELIAHLHNRLGVSVDILYGHSYGARLVYETCFMHPNIDSVAVLSGRSLFPEDALENSVLIDLMILRENQQEDFRKAFEIVKDPGTSMADKNEKIRTFFKDPQQRFRRRNDFIWGNEAARQFWEQELRSSEIADSDSAYFAICKTYGERSFNPGFFNPLALRQKMFLFQGYFDFLMNGSCTPNLGDERSTRFYGSGHFIHFEEPELFFCRLKNCLSSNG